MVKWNNKKILNQSKINQISLLSQEREKKKTMHEQNENIIKKTEIIKRNQKEMLKSKITEIKNTLQGLKGRSEQAEE